MLANDNLDAERGRATKDMPSLPYCVCFTCLLGNTRRNLAIQPAT